MNLSNICSKIITYSFYLLFFAVPLVWLPLNSELFEFNKMILVYFLTVVIATSWIIKGLNEKEFKVKKTPLDIPILLFLMANILSTIFSIDSHTSIFGYYGRWNGGLLSTVNYIILYYALLSNSDKKQTLHYLLTTIFSGTLTAIYGVLQHPNPLFQSKENGQTIFHGIDYNYWAVDVQSRVFSTFGQPNWFAAFLAMLIFPISSFLLVSEKIWRKALLFISFCLFYLAFTFTYSRGGLIGLAVGFLTFILLLPFFKENWWKKILNKEPLFKLESIISRFKNQIIWVLLMVAFIAISNIYFGNAYQSRGGINITQPKRPTQISQIKNFEVADAGFQTAKVRTIVWTGAFDIFKHYPLLGSGVETFGYSYYLFRPAEHNLAAEWDYLYNKAHNEYLTVLANTGTLGFLSYMFMLGLFEFLAVKIIIKDSWSKRRLIGIGILSGYNSYLAQNIFSFSVVPIALLFFIFPALFFVLTENLNDQYFKVFPDKFLSILGSKTYNQVLKLGVFLIGIFLALSVFSMWLGDFFYNNSSSANSYQEAIQDLRLSVTLVPYEPRYYSELAVNLSAFAQALNEEGKKDNNIKTASLEARQIINKLVTQNPNNIYLWQEKRTVDYNLSKIDETNFLELLRTAETLKRLMPTDASTQYDIALVYAFVGKPKEAEAQLETVVKLKADYTDAVMMLARVYVQNGKTSPAIKLLQNWLTKYPSDTSAQDLLKTLVTS